MINSVLFIYAHPDDETLFSGGTIAKLKAAGAKISLVTVTCGEKGRTSDECRQEDLAAARCCELKKAGDVLGIDRIFLLRHPDGAVGEADKQVITAEIAEIIREVRPEVLVTFDEDGANGHRDHKAVHKFVLNAVRRASADTTLKGVPFNVERLYYTNVAPEIMRYLGISFGDLAEFAAVDIKGFSAVKLKALKAHRTQTLSLSAFIGANERIWPYVFEEERFCLAPEYNQNGKMPYLK